MDRERLLDVAPHYLAMMFLILLVFNVLRVFFGDVSFWIEIGIAFVIVSAYRPAVKRLGFAPRAWEN